MEIHHFGPEVRTKIPLANSHGLTGAPIVFPPDEVARMGTESLIAKIGFLPFTFHGPTIVALHLEPHCEIPEHDAETTTVFAIIGGSGFVRVGGEDAPIQLVSKGDAILWPPHLLHTAWTTEDFLEVITIEYPP